MQRRTIPGDRSAGSRLPHGKVRLGPVKCMVSGVWMVSPPAARGTAPPARGQVRRVRDSAAGVLQRLVMGQARPVTAGDEVHAPFSSSTSCCSTEIHRMQRCLMSGETGPGAMVSPHRPSAAWRWHGRRRSRPADPAVRARYGGIPNRSSTRPWRCRRENAVDLGALECLSRPSPAVAISCARLAGS
jgi:hypothetical protein